LLSCRRWRCPPYPHQREALAAWIAAGRIGVIVLPTGAGKTYLAQLAMQATRRSTLIVVPTLDLMHQWYAHLLAAFPDASVGLLGGGSHDNKQIPRSLRRNELPVKLIDRALLMPHEYLAGSPVELLEGTETAPRSNSVLHHPPEAFDRIEVVATTGW
jgi:hypothetical protein